MRPVTSDYVYLQITDFVMTSTEPCWNVNVVENNFGKWSETYKLNEKQAEL